jgi:hypothetical protein
MNTKILKKCLSVLFILMLVCSKAICQPSETEIKNQQVKINYTSFTVSAIKQKIMIDWSTDNKVATNYFEIQRSLDGINFKTIALVLGPDPRKGNCDCYEGVDKTLKNKRKYFYRLKHVGTDGEVDLSETRMLAINN